MNVDLKGVENFLLQSLDGVSYISLKKTGRILSVEAYLAEQKIEAIDLKKPSIISSVKGKIREINVLSGTPCVSVGDEVNEGDVLIDGYFLKGEERFTTYALGEVEIVAIYEYVYQSFASGERYANRASVLARESLGDKNVINQIVEINEKDGKTIYTVTLSYLVTVS